jgi:hypothetical protein
LIENAGLDEQFHGENPVKNGYTFRMNIVQGSSNGPPKYEIWADPQSSGTTGTGARHFYTSSTLSTIKGNDTEPAKETDPSI